MKVSLIASALLLVGSCANISYTQKTEDLKSSIIFNDSTAINNYANAITSDALSAHVYTLSSSDLEGRATGEKGFDKASEYVANFYKSHSIASPLDSAHYYQSIPETYFSDKNRASHNVVAYIEGDEFPEEVLIISAHLDHLGMSHDAIYFGADDNASGTAALMEIARAFALAKDAGHAPKRSLLFLHLTAEEIGLYGSRYYVSNPIFPLQNTIANLNIDMVGRVDNVYINKNQEDYIYLIGADRLSTKLHYISEAANAKFTKLKLDYSYNKEEEPNRYYYRSDHYNFAQNNIPVIFYFNGEHDDYHLPTDTPDKINYPLLQKRAKLIFSTAWYLSNAEERLVAEKL